MMLVITNAYANVAASFFSAKFQRNVEELLVAPFPTHIIIAGYVGGGVARGVRVGVLVTVVSLFFVPLHVHAWWVVVVATLLLTAVLFSLTGLLNVLFAKTFDDISLIPTFVLTPLTYLGGVFYSLTLLPPFWQAVSKLQSRGVHDKRFPLRLSRHLGCTAGFHHGGVAGVYSGVLRAGVVADRTRARPAKLREKRGHYGTVAFRRPEPESPSPSATSRYHRRNRRLSGDACALLRLTSVHRSR